MLKAKTQIAVWISLYVFWLIFSVPYHPTMSIDIIVTAILLVAYVCAVYVNQLVLIPRLLRQMKFGAYFGALIAVMVVITFAAFTSVRAVYLSLWRPEEIGDYWSHFFIDLFGMGVHVALGAVYVAIAHRFTRKPDAT